jgi:hypothetical protein
MHPKRRERLLAIGAVVFIIAAWFIGLSRDEADVRPFLQQLFPEALLFEQIQGSVYAAWDSPEKENLLGYIRTGTADGYGGELKLAVAVSSEGTVLGLTVVGHKETTSFFRRVLRSQLFEHLKGKAHSDPFNLGQDVDGVTGATYSSRALVEAVKTASRQVAVKVLNLAPVEEPSPRIQFGLPEGVLLGLFLFGLITRWRRFRLKEAARWVSMLVGITVIGFVLNKPFTLVFINKILLGFWPKWQLELYWYILLGGIVFITLIDNRNPYCEWFCPFGATQECLGLIGGAKVRVPDRLHASLRWFQRGIALTSVVLAMIFRNPSVSSYEVFGAFFRLIGTNFHFVLLAVVLVAALFIRRPWCSYLCPLRPVTDFIRLVRNWFLEIWHHTVSPKLTS